MEVCGKLRRSVGREGKVREYQVGNVTEYGEVRESGRWETWRWKRA